MTCGFLPFSPSFVIDGLHDVVDWTRCELDEPLLWTRPYGELWSRVGGSFRALSESWYSNPAVNISVPCFIPNSALFNPGAGASARVMSHDFILSHLCVSF